MTATRAEDLTSRCNETRIFAVALASAVVLHLLTPFAAASSRGQVNTASFLIGTQTVGGLEVADATMIDAFRFFARAHLSSTARFSPGECGLAAPAIRLKLEFARLDSNGIGTPSTCRFLFEAVVLDPRWHTANGLRVGASASELKQLFPKARRFGVVPHTAMAAPHGANEWLLSHGAVAGVPELLLAFVARSRVVALGTGRAGH